VKAQHEIDMSDVAVVLLDGHYPKLQIALATAAVASNVPVVLDCGRWRPVFSELLPAATDVIMTGTFRPPGMEQLSVADTVVAMRERYGHALCAASRGPDAIVVADQAGLVEIGVPKVDVVDTTGAGDVLHGAYLHFRYTEGKDGRHSLQLAAAAASASCGSPGARNIGVAD
jgi:sugar/nucleoside kinase (ribokinase family)